VSKRIIHPLQEENEWWRAEGACASIQTSRNSGLSGAQGSLEFDGRKGRNGSRGLAKRRLSDPWRGHPDHSAWKKRGRSSDRGASYWRLRPGAKCESRAGTGYNHKALAWYKIGGAVRCNNNCLWLWSPLSGTTRILHLPRPSTCRGRVPRPHVRRPSDAMFFSAVARSTKTVPARYARTSAGSVYSFENRKFSELVASPPSSIVSNRRPMALVGG